MAYPSGVREEDAVWQVALTEVLNRAHLATPDQVADIVDLAVAPLAMAVELYLVDLGQRELRPVRRAGEPALSVQATAAGRAFARLEIVVAAEDGAAVLWVPVLDGTERLGAARMALPAGADPHDPALRERCWTLAGLIAHLVVGKQAYGDLFHRVRRTKPLSVASELLWQLLPPTAFACDRAVIAAAMEPYDRVGGDGYDYAVDDGLAHVAIFDAMGHDLPAGLITSLALAATRNARRAGADLVAAAALADETITAHRRSGTLVYATAFLASLDLDSGRLDYLNAGHPPPVVLRQGRGVRLLDEPGRTPLGLADFQQAAPPVLHEQLQPGDRVLFYSDGVVEARDAAGTTFGLDRLVDLTERHEHAGLPAPETLRRVVRAVLDHQGGELQDDATLLMLEWTTTDQARMLPAL
ncbi:serine/threonine protein phosphatase [Actinosynnema pretiosum]|uniref:Serine/threonine protein phosphatase n=1 Tax=Actinosynnema pretiosum TaxID=42197 RepID=A0A290Z6F6_9PSEU|nr:serine/threonine protein phosphatase [Actinosynnema pretiosum]